MHELGEALGVAALHAKNIPVFLKACIIDHHNDLLPLRPRIWNECRFQYSVLPPSFVRALGMVAAARHPWLPDRIILPTTTKPKTETADKAVLLLWSLSLPFFFGNLYNLSVTVHARHLCLRPQHHLIIVHYLKVARDISHPRVTSGDG